MAEPRVLVVSIRKSGTHLLKELMMAFRYAVYGAVSATESECPKVRGDPLLAILSTAYTEPELARLQACPDVAEVNAGIDNAVRAYYEAWRVRMGGPWPPPAGPGRADPALIARLLDAGTPARFADTPPGVAWFVHDLDLDRVHQAFLDEWLVTGQPRCVLAFRDPRDALVSMVRFLSDGAPDRVGFFPEHRIYREILRAAPSFEDRLTIALTDPCFPGLRGFERALWLRHHPRVCAVAYEDLVGPHGGGSAERQVAAVARVAAALRVEIDPAEVADGLYNTRAFTFRGGLIGAWRDAFTPEHEALFAARYGHLLTAFAARPADARVASPVGPGSRRD